MNNSTPRRFRLRKLPARYAGFVMPLVRSATRALVESAQAIRHANH